VAERVIFQKKAMPVDVGVDKTCYWRACGRRARRPFRDGAHKGAGIEPHRLHGGSDRQGLLLRLQTQQEGAALRRLAQAIVKSPFPEGTRTAYST